MTAWAEVVSAAMVLIDDVRLQEQLTVSPAQFYRRMAGMLKQGLTLLSRPPELLAWLKSGMIEPIWADSVWASTEASVNQETVLSTGQVGFDLCSVAVVTQDRGRTAYLPYAGATYDPTTGDVTFPAQDRDGIEYIIDFYRDGRFNLLSASQLRLAARAVAVVWDERFERNWLADTMKIKDDSFATVNESNYMDKTNARMMKNRQAFDDELRQYEQLCAYAGALRGRNVTLI